MATIQTIDIIKGISGKYGNKSNDYFATNKSSNKIHLAKLANPYKGPATEKQKVQREKFAKQQAASSAWLKANRPNEKNGIKGTPIYQYALKLKRVPSPSLTSTRCCLSTWTRSSTSSCLTPSMHLRWTARIPVLLPILAAATRVLSRSLEATRVLNSLVAEV